jgi:Raf kinase inhibitor-like YbhB/YbcL family protein
MFKLESEAFNDNELIPIKYCCDGQNISPPLHWINPPDNTVSFILIMDDPDAPHGTWDHWIIYNMPKEIRELAEGLKVSVLPLPAQLASNSWHHKSYGGPCPPYGEEHRYYFKLYGNNKDKWKQLGNTIPTIFTEIIGLNINKYLYLT